MTDAGHTETPWRVFTTPDGRKIVGVGDKDGQGILDRGFGVWAWNDAEGIANAELVVRAVNSHDDLVAALKDAITEHNNDGKISDWTYAKIQHAYAKATEGSRG